MSSGKGLLGKNKNCEKSASFQTRGCPFWDLNPNPVAACLANCMQNLDDLQDDMLECLVCSTINSLMKHFANCIHGYITCDLCTQIFSLICCHVNECIRTSTKFKKSVDTSMSICEIPLCEKIQQTLSGAEISGHLKMLWFNIRKKLSRVLGDTELHTERKSSVTMASTLESIPEDTPSTSMPYWRPSSRILSSKRSKLTMLGEGVESSDTSTNAAYRGTSIAGSIEMGQAPVTEGRKTRAALVDKHISLPMGPPRTSEGSFLSFVDRPVGIKGIGKLHYFNPFPNLHSLDLKASTENKFSNVTNEHKSSDKTGNIVGKGENAGWHHSFLFPQCL